MLGKLTVSADLSKKLPERGLELLSVTAERALRGAAPLRGPSGLSDGLVQAGRYPVGRAAGKQAAGQVVDLWVV